MHPDASFARVAASEVSGGTLAPPVLRRVAEEDGSDCEDSRVIGIAEGDQEIPLHMRAHIKFGGDLCANGEPRGEGGAVGCPFVICRDVIAVEIVLKLVAIFSDIALGVARVRK